MLRNRQFLHNLAPILASISCLRVRMSQKGFHLPKIRPNLALPPNLSNLLTSRLQYRNRIKEIITIIVGPQFYHTSDQSKRHVLRSFKVKHSKSNRQKRLVIVPKNCKMFKLDLQRMLSVNCP